MSVPQPRLIVIDKPVRRLAEQALCRAAGAPLVGGNAVDLLVDARDNYAAWLAAMRRAERRILLENYIIRDDEVGREFRAVLVERAEAGVRVHIVCDWLGCLGHSGTDFWRPLVDAGGEVRRYNPFQFLTPFGWVNRDHRKLVVVDRDVAFLGGLCISAKWLGDERRGIAPWRDTAVAVRGPAILEVEQAFADVWMQLGAPLPLLPGAVPEPVGDIDLRIVATQPDTAGMFRLDQMIAAMAQRSLWLADAYFVGLAPYVQALGAAAGDGVDVRLLVPGTSDLPLVRAMSRSGYRPLLEKGIRVFEWNGSMMHAKTAVADGRWARVGSSNLNVSSWLGNCELDVAIENAAFAQRMEEQYLRDLDNATEIVLADKRVRGRPRRPAGARAGGSSSRATASALRIAHSVGAAFGHRQTLAEGESSFLPWAATALFLFAALALVFPRLLAWPLALLAVWAGSAMLGRYVKLRTAKRRAAAKLAREQAAHAPESR
ncbi:MAG TPA: phospholipase D-like domain-containing protein [Rudaea sp.]|nr:phospholipase D-like domain-containing protein [Rudaea sp.]